MQYDEAFVTLMQSIIFNHIVYLWVWIKQTLAYSKHDVINDVFNRLLIEIIWEIWKMSTHQQWWYFFTGITKKIAMMPQIVLEKNTTTTI